MGLLTNLESLYIEGTDISGTIPSQVGNLQHLKELNLGDSPGLTGSLPTELGLLDTLTLLWIHDNPGLTGPIPSQLSELDQLTYFSLRGNSHTGPLPSELGLLTSLIEFRVGMNALTGSIPVSLGEMSSVRYFDIEENAGLTGRIPPKLCSAYHPFEMKFVADCHREEIVCCDEEPNNVDADGNSRPWHY